MDVHSVFQQLSLELAFLDETAEHADDAGSDYDAPVGTVLVEVMPGRRPSPAGDRQEEL